MIALYLIAAHMVGDYLLSNRWQAAHKLHEPWVRFRHVCGYCLPFMPIAGIYAHGWLWTHGALTVHGKACAFIVALFVLHFATDSHRFRSTLGDVIAWRWSRDRVALAAFAHDAQSDWPPPNPWAPMPILIDQSLHLVQLAVLGALFLS